MKEIRKITKNIVNHGVLYRGLSIMLVIVFVSSTLFAFCFSLTIPALADTDYMTYPQITVFTHGLAGSASHWSSINGEGLIFGEDYNSLVYKISCMAGGAQVYRAETSGGDTEHPSYRLYERYGTDIASINNSADHIIIVFDSQSSSKSNDVVYDEFRYMLNDVIELVRCLNLNGEKPKVNLIGHSRGGITNLQYALEYPENVDSLISIGTPYFGTELGIFGERLFGESNGLSDILNPDVYNDYYETWSASYEEKYKNINSIAIGGIANVSYLCDVLNADGSELSNALSSLVRYTNNFISQGLSYLGIQYFYSLIAQNHPDLQEFDESEFRELINVLYNEIHFGNWYGDGLVQVSSQQGIDGNRNYLFSKYVREFDSLSGSLNPGLAFGGMPPVVHNMETYDPIIHEYILNNIRVSEADEIMTEISNVAKETVTGDDRGSYKWRIKVRNTHLEPLFYVYNDRMCFHEDARNWSNLMDLESFMLYPGETTIVDIFPNGLATDIVISYTNTILGYRHRTIIYADNLWFNSNILFDDNVYQMNTYYSSVDYYQYSKEGIVAGIIDKIDNEWLIALSNNTGADREIFYNEKMCNFNDACNWTGLNDITSIWIPMGETKMIRIRENGLSTSISISYMDGENRKVYYANELDETNGTMSASSNTIYPQSGDNCLAAGTLITLADGTSVPVENLTGNEMLLVWNFYTGELSTAPILVTDFDTYAEYPVINLTFSDNTTVKIISEHGFWDYNLNSYVYLDENASDYIGHSFAKQSVCPDDNDVISFVQLTDVSITYEYTTAWSPVSYGHLGYFVNGMLSMPGGINGLFNIFDVNPLLMQYDSFYDDIIEYGLFSYEELSAYVNVPEQLFYAVHGEYLKIAIGKGLITYDGIQNLVNRYLPLFV